ncbi:MAG TPA: hypothetical protein PK677_17365 [Acidiphilium sp.]|nr:hypothetical protein [Acidiphilium sp.]
MLRALLSGGGTAASVNTGIKLAQAEDSENSDAFGLPLNQISQEQITSEYYNLQAKLAAVDPSNPLAAPDLAAPGWQPSVNDLAKLQGALEAYAAAPGQSLLPQVQLPNIGGNLVDPALVDQLVANGVKVTPGNVVATGTTPSGQIVFLETGSSNAGLQHIIDAHGTDFTNIGVSEDEIPSVVMQAVTEGNIVGYQGTGPGRPIYQIQINGQPQNIAVTVGFNGFIVGANPAGKMP